MKQILITKGEAAFKDVPPPIVGRGEILVEVTHSFISVGTELSVASGAKGNFYIDSVRNLDSLLHGLNLVRRKGVKYTWMQVRLASEGVETAAGYSCAGRVLEVGQDIRDIMPGDRVACAGAGIANHAELVSVPRNLVAVVPERLPLEQAASATVGSIALQGVRRADVRLGEAVAVVGLGLLGQIAVQLLVASGCRVLGSDPEGARRAKALELGASLVVDPTEEDVAKAAQTFGRGHGVDATILAAASKQPGLIQQAMEMTRRKGKVVLVGSIPIEFDRSPCYAKEIDFLISCSYGPGRYDPLYESKGIDYPFAYVRWTENRNIQAFLDLMAEGKISMPRLVDRIYPAEKANEAYAALRESGTRPLGIILKFSASDRNSTPLGERQTGKSVEQPIMRKPVDGAVGLAVLGAGAFARTMHLPNVEDLPDLLDLKVVVDLNGVAARTAAKQFQAGEAATDPVVAFESPDVRGVLITTRHNVHAELAERALRAGKSVLCEKPMGLSEKEVATVATAARESGQIYLVGFNRRFSPAARAIKDRIEGRQTPLVMVCRIACGHLPLDHWTQGAEGGGRIIGEACHWFDLMQFFAGDNADTVSVDVSAARPKTRGDWWGRDNFSATVRYSDGSIGTLIYCSLASTTLPKECIEVHWERQSAVLDDFRKAVLYGNGAAPRTLWSGAKQDKGHAEELRRWALSIRGEAPAPIPLESIERTSLLSCLVDRLTREDAAFSPKESEPES